ncbi:MAG: hypothetical protein AAB654_21305, partial [Acidobacteriota bacterium]
NLIRSETNSTLWFVGVQLTNAGYYTLGVTNAAGTATNGLSQRANLIKLTRWSPELSHARHLLFIGNGKRLTAESEWEVLAAAAAWFIGMLITYGIRDHLL